MSTNVLPPRLTECPTRRRDFGTVIQRKDGTWEGKYTYDGKRKSIYADTEEDIENALLMLKANIKNKIHVEDSVPNDRFQICRIVILTDSILCFSHSPF